MNLLLIETSGNQHYIFSTNKLRENVGASELTYRVGTKTVLDAVKKVCGLDLYAEDLKTLQQNLLDDTKNKPIETNNNRVEVIIATSGKAILLTKDKGKAVEIVQNVTKKALTQMPGLTVHGAIVDVEEDLTDIHDAVGKVHRRLEEIRYKIPGNQHRFQRLPFVEACATSGLPAEKIQKFEPEAKAYSKLAITKRTILPNKSDKGRIAGLLETTFDIKLLRNLEKFEEVFPETKWLAVIHADGNGLGEIFLRFDEHLNIKPNSDEKKTFKTTNDARKYIDAFRKFSIALDICTINAAGYALKKMPIEISEKNPQGEVPVIPLILGGDDLTVLCDGGYAIKFTKDFLEQFERETENLNETQELKEFGENETFKDIAGKLKYEVDGEPKNIIPFIAGNAFGIPRLGISAGIAIIKPHYPFHQAYSLAENLIKSAKLVKTKIQHDYNGKQNVPLPASAIDFHVLYDSSGVELKQIREKLMVDRGETHLFAKPYVVGKLNDEPIENDWLKNRTWNELENRVCAMKDKDEDDKNKLPNSQLHHIRESMLRDKRETDSEVNLFKHRYSHEDRKKDKGFGKLLCNNDSLFFDEKHKKDGELVDGHTTHFLDALDVVELWKGFDCPKTNVKDQNKNGGAE